MDMSEILGNLLGYLIFFGFIFGIPLFFLYWLYRNLAWRWRWRQWFYGYYASRGQDARRKDVERLITELSSSDKGLNKSALERLAQSGAKGVDLILAAIDMPYFVSRSGKLVFEEEEKESIFFKSINKIHPLLVGTLLNIGHHSPKAFMNALQNTNRNVRIVAMIILGHLRDASAVEVLLPFLDNPNIDERAYAMRALGEIKAANCFDKMVSSLKDDDVYIQATAISALGNIGDARALPYLEEFSRFDKTPVEGSGQTLGQLAEVAVSRIHNKGLQKLQTN